MILAILQARVSSTRLPGKVLKPLRGAPMILRQIERLGRSSLIDELLVATSTDSSDTPLADVCLTHGVNCFRGNLDDVLDRFYQAARSLDPLVPNHIVRLTGDCPLIDPTLIDQVIQFHLDGAYDFTSNALTPTFPDGLDTEIFTWPTLEQTWQVAKRSSEREHVTSYMETSEQFSRGNFYAAPDRSALRWTVDEPEDFQFVEEVYKALYSENSAFSSEDIYSLLARKPELSAINQAYHRNEGYLKSLQDDELVVHDDD
jgi:spore coat polysaccharide biosynthesis protein SpsF